MKATLGGGDLEKAVRCPPGEDKNEWIAVNTIQFVNTASLIYGTVVQYCTNQSCPTMAAGKASVHTQCDGHREGIWRTQPAAPVVDWTSPARVSCFDVCARGVCQ